jgi:hypothetical protein
LQLLVCRFYFPTDLPEITEFTNSDSRQYRVSEPPCFEIFSERERRERGGRRRKGEGEERERC